VSWRQSDVGTVTIFEIANFNWSFSVMTLAACNGVLQKQERFALNIATQEAKGLTRGHPTMTPSLIDKIALQ
jgi:hypothetical protein